MSAPLTAPVLDALVAVADRLGGAGVEWLLAGSAGRALLGFPTEPADLDVEVAGGALAAAAAALGLTPRESVGGGRSSRRATGAVAGMEVDLTADLAVAGAGGRLGPDFALQRAFAIRAQPAGRPVLVAPVEESLARAIVLGDWARIARIAREGDAARGAVAIRPDYLARRLSATASAAR